MTNLGQDALKCRNIILSACKMMVNARLSGPRFSSRDHSSSTADCHVLLEDATKLYCRYVSEFFGEPTNVRWAPALPDVLMADPEHCEETLQLIERKDFKAGSYIHFVAA